MKSIFWLLFNMAIMGKTSSKSTVKPPAAKTTVAKKTAPAPAPAKKTTTKTAVTSSKSAPAVQIKTATPVVTQPTIPAVLVQAKQAVDTGQTIGTVKTFSPETPVVTVTSPSVVSTPKTVITPSVVQAPEVIKTTSVVKAPLVIKPKKIVVVEHDPLAELVAKINAAKSAAKKSTVVINKVTTVPTAIRVTAQKTTTPSVTVETKPVVKQTTIPTPASTFVGELKALKTEEKKPVEPIVIVSPQKPIVEIKKEKTETKPIAETKPISVAIGNAVINKDSTGKITVENVFAKQTKELETKKTILTGIQEKFEAVRSTAGEKNASLGSMLTKIETGLAKQTPIVGKEEVKKLSDFKAAVVSANVPSDKVMKEQIQKDLSTAGLQGQTSVIYGNKTITGKTSEDLVNKLADERKSDIKTQLNQSATDMFKQIQYGQYNIPNSVKSLGKESQDKYKDLLSASVTGKVSTPETFSKEAGKIVNTGVQNLTDQQKINWYKTNGLYEDTNKNQVSFSKMKADYEKNGYTNIIVNENGTVSFTPPSAEFVGKQHYNDLVKQYVSVGNDKNTATNLVNTRLGAVAVMESPLAVDAMLSGYKNQVEKSAVKEFYDGKRSGKWTTVDDYLDKVNKGNVQHFGVGGNRTNYQYIGQQLSQSNLRTVLNTSEKDLSEIGNKTLYQLAAADIGYQSALKGETTPVSIMGFEVGKVSGPLAFGSKILSGGAVQQGVLLPAVTLGLGYGAGKLLGSGAKVGSKLISEGVKEGSKLKTVVGTALKGESKVAGYTMLGTGVAMTGQEIAMTPPEKLPSTLLGAGLAWGTAAKGAKLAEKPIVKTEIGLKTGLSGERTLTGQKYIGSDAGKFRFNITGVKTADLGKVPGANYEPGKLLVGEVAKTEVPRTRITNVDRTNFSSFDKFQQKGFSNETALKVVDTVARKPVKPFQVETTDYGAFSKFQKKGFSKSTALTVKETVPKKVIRPREVTTTDFSAFKKFQEKGFSKSTALSVKDVIPKKVITPKNIETGNYNAFVKFQQKGFSKSKALVPTDVVKKGNVSTGDYPSLRRYQAKKGIVQPPEKSSLAGKPTVKKPGLETSDFQAFSKYQKNQTMNPWKESKLKTEKALDEERAMYGGKTKAEHQAEQKKTFAEEKIAEKQAIKQIQKKFTPEQVSGGQVSIQLIKKMPVLEKYGNKVAVTREGQRRILSEKAKAQKSQAVVNRLGTSTQDVASFVRYQRQALSLAPGEKTVMKTKAATQDINSFLKYQRQMQQVEPGKTHYATKTGKTTPDVSWQRGQVSKMVLEKPKVKAKTSDIESYNRWLKQQRALERMVSSRNVSSEKRAELSKQDSVKKQKRFLRAEMNVVEGVPMKSEYYSGIKKQFKLRDIVEKQEGKIGETQTQRNGQQTILEKPTTMTKKIQRKVQEQRLKSISENERLRTVNQKLINIESKSRSIDDKWSNSKVEKVLSDLKRSAINRLNTKMTTVKQASEIRRFISGIDDRLGKVRSSRSKNTKLVGQINKLKEIRTEIEKQIQEGLSETDKLKLPDVITKIDQKIDVIQEEIQKNEQEQEQINKSIQNVRQIQEQVPLQIQQQDQSQKQTQIQIQRPVIEQISITEPVQIQRQLKDKLKMKDNVYEEELLTKKKFGFYLPGAPEQIREYKQNFNPTGTGYRQRTFRLNVVTPDQFQSPVGNKKVKLYKSNKSIIPKRHRR